MVLVSAALGLWLLSADPRLEAVMLPNGLALPYPTVDVYRAFGRCTGAGRHDHEGVDLGGLGPHGGLGTAVRSLARARITRIARGSDDPILFGPPDDDEGLAHRNGLDFPRRLTIAGYGEVLFFTKRQGAWRTGSMVVSEGLDPPLAQHRIRYLHLGAVRPDLTEGEVLEAGEELGILGGSGVQHDWPHLHVDIRDADGEPVDIAPLIGMPRSASCGSAAKRAFKDYRAFAQVAGTADWRPRTWAPPIGAPSLGAARGWTPPPLDLVITPPALVATGLLPEDSRVWQKRFGLRPCARWSEKEDFSTGAFEAHVFEARLAAGQSIDVSLVRRAGPRLPTLAVVDADARAPLGAEAFVRIVESPRRVRARLTAPADVRVLVTLLAPPADTRRQVGYQLELRDRCAVAGAGR